MFLNELIFRDRKEFNKFLEKHTTDGKFIDISSFTDMPECVKNLTIEDDGVTLNAATFFIMEELDIEMRPITKEEILDYVIEKKLRRCYQKLTPEDIVQQSKNYGRVLSIMEWRGFEPDEFYEYGKNAFESLICYNSANYHKWINNSFGILTHFSSTKIDKEKMRISWGSYNKNCLLMVNKCKVEAYYRAADDLGLSTASEMWITEDERQCMSSHYDTFPHPLFGPKDTKILKAFLSGKDIKEAKVQLGY